MTFTMGTLRTLLGAVLLATAVAGCEDGVEIKSPLLNSVAGSLGAGSKKEPQLADRPGLVIPPSTTAALPQPGSGQAVTAAINAQLPKGAQQTTAAAAAEKKKNEEDACKQSAKHAKDPNNGVACPGLFAKLLAASQDGQNSEGDQPQ
jgi:hypothetical protein